MVLHEIAGAERVGVVGEGTGLDAFVGADAVAAKAEGGVEHDGFGEGADVEAFVPVAGRVGVSGLVGKG